MENRKKSSLMYIPATNALLLSVASAVATPGLVALDATEISSAHPLVQRVLAVEPAQVMNNTLLAGKDFDKCHDKTKAGPVEYSRERNCPKMSDKTEATIAEAEALVSRLLNAKA